MVLYLPEAGEVVSPSPFRPDGSNISIDTDVLLRLAGLDMDQTDPGFLRPIAEPGADVFRAIVDPDRQWPAAPSNDPGQCPYDTF